MFTRKRLFAVASVIPVLAVASPVARVSAAPVTTTPATVQGGGGYGHHGYGRWSNGDD